MRKASIEVSVNFLVMIIISIVVLGIGIYLISNMNVDTDPAFDELKEITESILLESGRPIAIPIVQKEIERGSGDFFAIGVTNVLKDTSANTFEVSITFLRAYDSQGIAITTPTSGPGAPGNWLVFSGKTATLNPNDVHVFDPFFRVPKDAKKGLYIYDVEFVNPSTTSGFSYKEDKYQIFIQVP